MHVRTLLALVLLASAAHGAAVVRVASMAAYPSPGGPGLPAPARAELEVSGLAVAEIELSGSGAFGALDLRLGYDPEVLQFVDAGPALGSKGVRVQGAASGKGEAKVSLATSAPLAEGPILRVRFRVLGRGGDRSAIQVIEVKAFHAERLTEEPVRGEAGELFVEDAGLSVSSKVVVVAFPAVVGLLFLIGGIRCLRRGERA